MACDLRIASSTAKFGQPEINLGLIPGWGGTRRLPRLAGYGNARYLIYTGEIIDAEEAFRMGLINKIVEPEKLLDTAIEVAKKILSKSPFSIKLAKEALSPTLSFEEEADYFALLFATKDTKEGIDAFLERRKPEFQGK
jgi:enoyl-CoA hydratase